MMTSCLRKWSKVESQVGNEVKEGKKMAKIRRKPGGWKSMPYILGNETVERLATFGVTTNFMVYLQTQLHMKLVSANNLINIWSGCTNFAPLLGAFLSDAYLGRFRTIVYASFACLLGLGLLTITAWNPQLHPPKCTAEQLSLDECLGPTPSQLGALIAALTLIGIGTGGIKPCIIPFGVDQFDPTTEKGRSGIASFFNWYYASFTVVLLFSLTVIVYIQTSVSWVLGFGISTGLMLASIILFFIGTRVYVYVNPEGSVFTDMFRVFVAAYKKRKAKLPETEFDAQCLYYDPPSTVLVSEVPLTKDFRFLNKAAMITDATELSEEGVANDKWRLCSIKQIEEAKCLLRIVPIWVSGIICYLAMAQQSTFTIAQALKMDRHLFGPHFQIPPGTVSFISMITVGFFVPIYERILIPLARRFTHIESGITILQRMGIGMVFFILSMIAAGRVETARRHSANAHGHNSSQMSVWWLAPQLVLMGVAETFNVIGQIEFFNMQFPENMRSIGNSLVSVSQGGASYLSAAIVVILHKTTAGENGRPDWLTNNINDGKLDNLYYITSVLGILNLVYFLAVARRYKYKSNTVIKDNIGTEIEMRQAV